jgi:hypothetical protein
METAAVVAFIIGGLLIVAGIVWIFLAATNVIKEAGPELESRQPQADYGWPELIRDFLKWLKENIRKKLLPGIAMIVIGAAIIIATALALGGDDSGSDGTSEQTETTTPAET